MREKGVVAGSLGSAVTRSGPGLAAPGGVVAGILALAVAVPGLGGQRPPRDVDLRTWMAESARGGSVVSGRVRTRTGQGLPDAVVTLERGDAPGRGSSTLTDAGGRYRFDRVPAGRYQVFAVKTGFGRRYHGEDRRGEPPAVVDVGPGRKTDAVDVVLPRGAVVTGRLRDDAGLLAPGATVFLLQRVSERGATSLRMAGADRTDDQGPRVGRAAGARVLQRQPARHPRRAVRRGIYCDSLHRAGRVDLEGQWDSLWEWHDEQCRRAGGCKTPSTYLACGLAVHRVEERDDGEAGQDGDGAWC